MLNNRGNISLLVHICILNKFLFLWRPIIFLTEVTTYFLEVSSICCPFLGDLLFLVTWVFVTGVKIDFLNGLPRDHLVFGRGVKHFVSHGAVLFGLMTKAEKSSSNSWLFFTFNEVTTVASGTTSACIGSYSGSSLAASSPRDPTIVDVYPLNKSSFISNSLCSFSLFLLFDLL